MKKKIELNTNNTKKNFQIFKKKKKTSVTKCTDITAACQARSVPSIRGLAPSLRSGCSLSLRTSLSVERII